MELSATEQITAARMHREKLLADKNRPGFHFAIPEDMGLPGDPNGAFFANGRYHLMYLYHCESDGYRYGHISSVDLLHWRWHPDALIPDEFDGGIFSGGAFVDDDGTAYVTYWGLQKEGAGKGQGGIRIAFSRDIENHYEKWTKMPEYAVESDEWGVTNASDGFIGSADPSNIWKQNGTYYMQTGNLCVLNLFRNRENVPEKYLGDFTELFSSNDLKSWTHLGRFYSRRRDNSWTDETEDDMCPSFLPLPDGKNSGKSSGKYLQLFIAHNRGAQYYIGTYDRENNRFIPERHGRMSNVDNCFFAPEAVMTPDGRQVMWAWMTDNPSGGWDINLERGYGWSGVYSFPRSLWLNGDGELGMAPIDELDLIKYNHTYDISRLSGTSCAIHIVFGSVEGNGIRVRCSADGKEFTRISYSEEKKLLLCDMSKSGKHYNKIETMPFELKNGERLDFTILIDNSVIEIFLNDRQAISRRVYPDPESRKIIFEGDVLLAEGWEIMPTNMF